MTVALSLCFTSRGIDKDITVAKYLITVFISLEVAAVRDLNELAFS